MRASQKKIRQECTLRNGENPVIQKIVPTNLLAGQLKVSQESVQIIKHSNNHLQSL